MKKSLELFTASLFMAAPQISFACEPVPQLLMDTVHTKNISLIGEYHGTQETPQAFYNLVCNVLEQEPNQPLTVGFELSAIAGMELTDQASLDKWLAADQEWIAPHDGRSSQAMYQLLQRMVQTKQMHPNLSILLFNVPTGEYEKLMAQNILHAYKGQKMLILSGNYHTKIKMTNESDFENAPIPMGEYIFSQYPQQTTSIVISYNGSTQWAWGEDGIGVYKVGKSQLTAPHQARVLKAAEAAQTGYEIAWNVGEAHASYPQVHSKKDDSAHMPAPQEQ